MTKRDFLKLMRFPAEWDSWGMYPDDLLALQIAAYNPGHEAAPEHYRNGAFHWWLRKDPDTEVLGKLVDLSYLDPDPLMGKDVRRYVERSKHFSAEVAAHFRSTET